jgi:hydroxymethylbilane synthase
MEESPSKVLRLGTRGSLLARTQSHAVAVLLEQHHPGLRVEEIVLVTSGDVIQDRPLHQVGGKGLFTKEIEIALLEEKIDFAVHSFKDVPVTEPLVEQRDLIIAAVPKREDPADVLVSVSARAIAELPKGARVGTGSLRRRCQLLALRPDLTIEPIRGNIDTRIRKLREGQFDAVVLALAGVKRASLFDPQIMFPLDQSVMIPAPGQGALALQCRRDDAATRHCLASIDDPVSMACTLAERALVRYLGGDCLSPIAAHATPIPHGFRLIAAVGARGGGLPVIHAVAQAAGPETAARDAYRQLEQQDAPRNLHGSSA